MWVRKACIRPVPPYARVTSRMLEAVRNSILTDPEQAQEELDQAFAEFEQQQPALADYIGETLSRPFDDACLALGYFLSLAVWLAFREGHGRALKTITPDELRGTIELMQLDEDLRQDEPNDPLETDDIVGMEQPDLLRFLHEHIEATLDVQGDAIDPEQLQTIYRIMLVEVLALSYAVAAPMGFPATRIGIQA